MAVPTAGAAPTAPTPLVAAGPFSAESDASLLTVDVPALAGTPDALLPQTNVDLARSSADADSDADLDPGQDAAQRTAAAAGTTGSTSLLGEPVDIQSAFASAPESEVDDPDPLIPIPADPLLNVSLIDVAALANWVSDTECVAATDPLSLADQALADATVLAIPDGPTLVDVLPGDDGAVDTEASTALPATGGPNDQRAITATALTRLAGASVLTGLDEAPVVDVNVVQAPNYTVSATGQPGGASVTGDDPIVDVSIGGEPVITLHANETEETAVVAFTLDMVLGGRISEVLGGTPLDPLVDPLAPILNPLEDAVLEALLALQPIVRLSIPVETFAAADGTAASVDASLLLVEVLAPDATGATEPVADALADILAGLGLDTTEPLAAVELAPLHAAVVAPAGGIFCGGVPENPLELGKQHSGPAVPGSTFDYSIVVGNVSGVVGPECTMDPVRVVDLLTGPAGSTIVLTEPAGATVTPVSGGFRIEWANVGPIQPGDHVTLRIRVQVPANATVGDRYHDDVTATTTCNGQALTRNVRLDEPAVVARPTGPCNITGSRKSKSHIEVYPGETFVYLVNVLNSGSEPCTNVTVSDTLDNRLTFESCSDGCTNSGQNVTWNLGTLAGGQSISLSVEVRVNLGATGELANAAVIDTAETGPTTVNVTGPRITDTSVLSDGNPAVLAAAPLARTGGMGTVPVSIAIGLAAAAVGLHHLRRRVLT